MSQPEAKITVKGYGVDSTSYFRRGQRNFNQFEKENRIDWLFYTALEYRNCIEKLLYEYLVLTGHESWSKALEKKYRPKELKNEILVIEPEFLQKIQFASLWLQSIGSPGIHIIDLDKLSGLYGMLGNYLHAAKRPEKTAQNPKWWGRLHTTLVETEKELAPVFQHDIGNVKLNEEGWEMYERWKTGETTDEDVMREFRESLMA